MKRYYRVLFLLAVIGAIIGTAGGFMEQHTIFHTGCLVIPALSYLLAIVIDLIRGNENG